MSLEKTDNTNSLSPALIQDLEPTVRTKHPNRRRGVWKCLCYSFTIILSIIFVVLGIAIQKLWKDSLVPHKNLYQDLLNDAPYKPQEVVRPLMDKDQKFDIVATVWIRNVESRAKSRGRKLVETAIFTETIFRGIKMSDKNIKTSVNLEIPTSVFKDKQLSDHDLRGSFVLVPNSPSPLDNVLNYSTWIPTAAEKPPSRVYPNGYIPSLADEVVDAYGTFSSLLSFHDIKSSCQPVESSSTSAGDENKANTQGSAPLDEDEEVDIYAIMYPDRPRKEKNEVTTKGKLILESHPYIVTRSHLSVIDMTKLYNREAYEMAHKQLSATECGELSRFGLRTLGFPPDWRLCDRSFADNGNHEVMIEYSPKSNEQEEAIQYPSQWTYAPYFFVDQNAWGPFDLVAVPVNREECVASPPIDARSTSGHEDIAVMNITWNVSFGSTSPRSNTLRKAMGDTIYRQFNMTDNEEALQSTHSQIEFIQSLFGHNFNENRWPVLIGSVLLTLSLILGSLAKVLEFLYWYNHAPISTVGISIVGAKFSAGGALLDHFFRCIFVTDTPLITLDWAWEFLHESLFEVLVLKAVTKAEFVWSKKKWIVAVPVGLRFAVRTHAERTSERLEAETSLRFRQLIFLLLGIVFCISYVNGLYIVPPKVRRPAETLRLNKLVLLCQNLFVFPMTTLGWILQLVMNFRSKTFAGMQKLAAYSGCLASLALVASEFLWTNSLTMADGISLLLLFEIMFYSLMSLQAMAYPKPSPIVDTNNE